MSHSFVTGLSEMYNAILESSVRQRVRFSDVVNDRSHVGPCAAEVGETVRSESSFSYSKSWKILTGPQVLAGDDIV